jgi:rhodanese-related sulfurtransferase
MKIIKLLAVMMMLLGCSANPNTNNNEKGYKQMKMAEAMQYMQQNDDYILVDVRRQDEYDAGYIPGAICIPNETITDKDIPELPNKDEKILVYCRSGNRSVQASEKLVKLGYTNIIEIGGINDYTGEISANR